MDGLLPLGDGLLTQEAHGTVERRIGIDRRTLAGRHGERDDHPERRPGEQGDHEHDANLHGGDATQGV